MYRAKYKYSYIKACSRYEDSGFTYCSGQIFAYTLMKNLICSINIKNKYSTSEYILAMQYHWKLLS